MTIRCCNDCKHCIGGLRVVGGPYGPRIWPDSGDNRCAHATVVHHSVIYAATGRPPLCTDARRDSPCGLAGHLFQEKPPQPVAEPQTRTPSWWHRLLFGRMKDARSG